MRRLGLALLSATLLAHAWAESQLAEQVARHPAFGPALSYRSLAAEIAQRQWTQSAAELRRSGLGLSASLSYRPSVAWRGRDGDDFELANSTFSHTLGASAALRHDPQAIARAELTEQRASVTLSERINRDLREALSLHIDLQRAHIALTLARDAAASRAITLASAEAVDLERIAPDPTSPEPNTLLASRLELERAEAAVTRTARDLDNAERQAQPAGFNLQHAADSHRERLAPLPLEGWRLALPASDPLSAPEVRRAIIDLSLAEANAGRVRAAGIVPELQLAVTRSSEQGRASASLSLAEGRPSAALSVSLQSATRPSWSVLVSAVVRVDDSYPRELARSQAAIDDAALALADTLTRAEWSLLRARQLALDAEEDIAFAERGLALGRANLRDAILRWQAHDRDNERDATRADTLLARAAIALERARDAFYRAWNHYLLEAERAWNMAGVLGGVLAPAP